MSMGFPRQEYWSGLPFPSPKGLPDPRIELALPALAGRVLTTELPGKHGIFITEPHGKPNQKHKKHLKLNNNGFKITYANI